MSGPGVTSISRRLSSVETPVWRPPVGNATHSVQSGRRHVCAKLLEASISSMAASKSPIRMVDFSPFEWRQLRNEALPCAILQLRSLPLDCGAQPAESGAQVLILDVAERRGNPRGGLGILH